MAVALEVFSWGRSGSVGAAAAAAAAAGSRKRSWSDDQEQRQKLLEMMLGKPKSTTTTLDLLGSSGSSSSSSSRGGAHNTRNSTHNPIVEEEMVELGADTPLPSGWEKRLDLKSGLVYFTNCSTGTSTCNDPRLAAVAVVKPLSTTRNLLLGRDKVHHHHGLSSNSSSNGSNSSGSNGNSSSSIDLKLNLCPVSTTTGGNTNDDDACRRECLQLLPIGKGGEQHKQQQQQQFQLKQQQQLQLKHLQEQQQQQQQQRVTLTCCKRCLLYVMISRCDPRCPKCGCSVLLVDFPIPKRRRLIELQL